MLSIEKIILLYRLDVVGVNLEEYISTKNHLKLIQDFSHIADASGAKLEFQCAAGMIDIGFPHGL